MNRPTTRTVGAVHAAPVYMDTAATIDKVAAFIKEAAGSGVELLVFPEVFVPGYPYWINTFPPLDQGPAAALYASASIEVPGPEILEVQRAAARHGVGVVLGVSERLRGSRTCFISQVLIDSDGVLLGVHRKLQPTLAERMIWAQGGGATLKVHQMKAGRVGAMVCWEHTMNLARHSYIEQGEQIHAAAWPGLSTQQGFETAADLQIEAMMRNHALTAQVFTIASSLVVDQACLDWISTHLGDQDKVTAGGGWSAITHPFGHHLAGPHTGGVETIVIAEIDLADIDDVKTLVDSRGHYARREVLRMTTDPSPLWHDESPEPISLTIAQTESELGQAATIAKESSR